MATLRQAPEACKAASSFWTDFGKVMGFVNFDLGFGMAWAAKPQTWSHGVSHPEHVDDFLPHINVRICIGVTNQVHSVLSSTEKNIDSICGPEESDSLLFVAPDKRDNDNLGLFTLEIIDCRIPQDITEFLLFQNGLSV